MLYIRAVLFLLPILGLVFEGQSWSADTEPNGADLMKFGRQLEADVATGQGTFFESIFNVTAIATRAVEGLEMPEAEKSSFLDQCKDNYNIYHVIKPALEQGGTFKFTQPALFQGQRCAQFRLVLPNGGGVNYYNFLLARKPGGLLIRDVHVLLNGDWLSGTIRRAALPVALGLTAELADKLTGAESSYVKSIPKLDKASAALKEGKYQDALAILNGLPQDIQQDRGLLVLRLDISKNIGIQEFDDTLATIQKNFPNDLGFEYILIDAYISKKDFATAHKKIDSVNKILGFDAYMDVMHATLYLQNDDFDGCKTYVQRAINAEPTLFVAYNTLAAMYLKQKDFKGVLSVIEKLQNALNIPLDDLVKDDQYADFVKSEEFKVWKKKHKQ